MSESDPSYNRRMELEEFARKSSHNDRTCSPVTVSLVARAHAEAVRRGDGQLAFGLLKTASDIVWGAMYALAPIVRLPDPYHGRLWQHRDTLPDPAYAGEFAIRQWAPDQAEVESLAADYLRQPWMSDGHLDWCLLDALTFREIAGYEASLAVSFPRSWTAGWVFQTLFTAWIPWLIEAGIAAGSVAWLRTEFASPEQSPYRWWWAGAVGVYYVLVLGRVPRWVRVRRARRKALAEIAGRLRAMHGCYADLSGPVLDPTRVRDALLAAEGLGVRWSSATWPLLEGVIARDPHRWLTTLG